MFMVSDAHAQGLFGGGKAAAGTPGGVPSFLLYLPQIVLMFLIFYLLLIRPQQVQAKKTKQMLSALKKGDKVVTSGGLMGVIVGLDEQKVVLRVADEVKMEFLRASVTGVISAEGHKS
jgi:preprotein translocase subunit YajC